MFRGRMESIASPALWAGFFALVAVMIAVDLGVFHRRTREVTAREAVVWTLVWIGVSLAFAGVMAFAFGASPAVIFVTAYVLEKSLSVDNIFVFILVFAGFSVPLAYQHRVLFWGILGAIILRGAFILAGAAIVGAFHWVLYVFGIILLYSGGKLLFGGGDDDEPMDVDDHRVTRFFKRFVPMTSGYRGAAFFVRENGKLMATPLFLVLAVIEVSDIVFAVDSIPTVLAVTHDPFIAFTSNIFAILGLRAIYFVLAAVLPAFHLLKRGIALVLLFVAAKILLMDLVEISPTVSLATVGTILTLSVVLSRIIPEKKAPEAQPDAPVASGGESPTVKATEDA